MKNQGIGEFKLGAGENDLRFPLTQGQISRLKPCRLVNPTVGAHLGIKYEEDFDPKRELNELIQIAKDIAVNKAPTWYMKKYWPFEGEHPGTLAEPLIDEGLSYMDPKGCGYAVKMDLSGDIGGAMLNWCLNNGYNVKAGSPDIINFIESVPDMEYLLARDCRVAINKAFRVKNFYGRFRPQEYYTELTGKDASGFVLYNCPNHPAYGSGHSAISAAAAKCIIDNFALDHRGIMVILHAAFDFSFFRNWARIHWSGDNLASFVLCGLKKYMKPEIVDKYLINP